MSLLFLAVFALAQSTEDDRAWGPPDAATTTTAPAAPRIGERVVPDYDGRPAAPPSLGKSLLWIPRVPLAPLYVLEKYVVYPPVRAGIRWFERAAVAKKVERALTIGDPDGAHALVLPTALFDFGFRPSIGLMLLGSDIGSRGRNSFRLNVAYGGSRWLAFGGRWEHALTGHDDPWSELFIGGDYLHRPDEVFAGVGADTPGVKSRYTRLRIGGRLGADLYLGLYDHIRISGGFQRNEFAPGKDEMFDDPNIAIAYDPSSLAGFDGGYGLLDLTISGIADTRLRRPQNGSGGTAGFKAVLGTDVTGDTASFARLSGSLAAHWDVTRTNRVFTLRQWASTVVDPSDRRDVAFTELVTMGGIERHRGFLRESLRGESGLLTTLEYSWPVWVWLDATLFAEVGGVYGPNNTDADLGTMRSSFGMGFNTKDRNLPLNAQIGFGTSAFKDDMRIDNFRFTVGTTGLN